MGFREDIAVDWAVSPRIIEVAADSTEVTIQDLVDTCRTLESEIGALDDDYIIDATGKEPLGGGVAVGITAQLNNARLKFQDRSGEPWVVCNVGGGNLVATNISGEYINPIEPSAYVTVTKTSSSSATLLESGFDDALAGVESQVSGVSAQVTEVSGQIESIDVDVDIGDSLSGLEVQVSGVSAQVAEVSGQIESLDVDVDIGDSLSGLEMQVSGVSAQVTEVSGQIDNIEVDVDIGDSLSGISTQVSGVVGCVNGVSMQVSGVIECVNNIDISVDDIERTTQEA